MSFDSVLSHMGGFGKYQKRLYFGLFLAVLNHCFFTLGHLFFATIPKYRCTVSHGGEAVYILDDPVRSSWSVINSNLYSENWPCSNWTLNARANCMMSMLDANSSNDKKVHAVCDYNLAEYIQISGAIGILSGGLIFGVAGDRWGRRKMLLVYTIIYPIIGGLMIFVPNFELFLTFRTILGILITGILEAAYILVVESSEQSKRHNTVGILALYYSIGCLGCCLLLYFSSNWTRFQLISVFYAIPAFIIYWFTPESTRWLVVKGKIQQGKQLIQNSTNFKKINMSDATLDELLIESIKHNHHSYASSVTNLFNTPDLRNAILIFLLFGTTISMITYGILWNIAQISENVYITLGVVGAAGVFEYLLTISVSRKIRRRLVLFATMSFTGIFFNLAVLPLDDYKVYVISLLLCKIFLAVFMNFLHIYNVEIFPTEVRCMGLGTNFVGFGIGILASSYLFQISHAPKVIIGFIFLASVMITASASLALPETRKRRLPDTIEDLEEIDV